LSINENPKQMRTLMNVVRLRAPRFDAFIAAEDGGDDFIYLYGGTRSVPPTTPDDEVMEELSRLQRDESGLKNSLINVALHEGPLTGIDQGCLPSGFMGSRVGGARCILRPADDATARIIADPSCEEFEATILPVFEQIGEYLNGAGGHIKLTPDFGRNAGLADLLYRYTPHVLGIGRERGGCGGKSSYSTTGIIAAFEALGCHHIAASVTLIGAAGAMGSGFLRYLRDGLFQDVAVCDLAYDRSEAPVAVPTGVAHVSAELGRFTRACLERGGVIVATTLGRELENSPWDLLPRNTVFLLAHNLAVPSGEQGQRLMRDLQTLGVKAYPGQVLTLGGALTSRLEWFWRQGRPGVPFDKLLAHDVVRAVITSLVQRIELDCRRTGATPLNAMRCIAAVDRSS
jgi:hypothetical protein